MEYLRAAVRVDDVVIRVEEAGRETVVGDVAADQRANDVVPQVHAARVHPGMLIEGLPLWQQPWATQLAKQIVGALLVLVVAFLVLRPVMKSCSTWALWVLICTCQRWSWHYYD